MNTLRKAFSRACVLRAHALQPSPSYNRAVSTTGVNRNVPEILFRGLATASSTPHVNVKQVRKTIQRIWNKELVSIPFTKHVLWQSSCVYSVYFHQTCCRTSDSSLESNSIPQKTGRAWSITWVRILVSCSANGDGICTSSHNWTTMLSTESGRTVT